MGRNPAAPGPPEAVAYRANAREFRGWGIDHAGRNDPLCLPRGSSLEISLLLSAKPFESAMCHEPHKSLD